MVKLVNIEEEVKTRDGINLTLDGKKVSVKGKLGTISKDFSHARQIGLTLLGDQLFIRAEFPRRNTIALVKTIKNLIENMMLGVEKGYTYRMKIVYSHFPITVETPKKGSNVILIKNFIGERAPRTTYSVGDVKVKADKEEVIITGIDKEEVGQTAANIQKRCNIKDKDKRVFQDGVYVYSKELGEEQFWVIK